MAEGLSLALILLLLFTYMMLATMRLALAGATHTEVSVWKERGHEAAGRVLLLVDDLDRVLMSFRLAIMLTIVAISILTTWLLGRVFHVESSTGLLFFLAGVACLVLLLMIFGEALPRFRVGNEPAIVAIRHAKALQFVHLLMRPGTALLRSLAQRPPDVARTNGLAGAGAHGTNTRGGEEEDGAGEKQILRGIARFADTEVKQVMRPRTEVVAFDQRLPLNELMPAMIESGFSRVPIHDGTLDHVVGILYLKDLLPLAGETQVDPRTLWRRPFFVAESMPLDRLLRKFQELKVHLAVVVDEYGATSGIITLEGT